MYATADATLRAMFANEERVLEADATIAHLLTALSLPGLAAPPPPALPADLSDDILSLPSVRSDRAVRRTEIATLRLVEGVRKLGPLLSRVGANLSTAAAAHKPHGAGAPVVDPYAALPAGSASGGASAGVAAYGGVSSASMLPAKPPLMSVHSAGSATIAMSAAAALQVGAGAGGGYNGMSSDAFKGGAAAAPSAQQRANAAVVKNAVASAALVSAYGGGMNSDAFGIVSGPGAPLVDPYSAVSSSAFAPPSLRTTQSAGAYVQPEALRSIADVLHAQPPAGSPTAATATAAAAAAAAPKAKPVVLSELKVNANGFIDLSERPSKPGPPLNAAAVTSAAAAHAMGMAAMTAAAYRVGGAAGVATASSTVSVNATTPLDTAIESKPFWFPLATRDSITPLLTKPGEYLFRVCNDIAERVPGPGGALINNANLFVMTYMDSKRAQQSLKVWRWNATPADALAVGGGGGTHGLGTHKDPSQTVIFRTVDSLVRNFVGPNARAVLNGERPH